MQFFSFFFSGLCRPNADEVDYQNDDDYASEYNDDESGQDKSVQVTYETDKSDPPYFEEERISKVASAGKTAILPCDLKNRKRKLTFS